MLHKPLSTRYLIFYSLLAFPLACIELPLYLHIPKFYIEFGTISLETLGLILFSVRCIDALKDPFIGGWVDARVKDVKDRVRLIICCLPILCVGFYFLCHPSLSPNISISLWLILSLLLVQSADSIISIIYNALGADLSANYHDRTRIVVCRESWRLYGVFFAAALPTFLFQKTSVPESFHWLSLIFILLMGIGGLGLIIFCNLPKEAESTPVAEKMTWALIFSALQDRSFRWLIAIFFVNGIAISIPATLVLFFIKDTLDAEHYAGYFIALYFLAGALGMSVWKRLSHAFGKRQCWKFSIIISALIFVWTFTLTSHDYLSYGLICFFSGLALGGDLAIPPSLVADMTQARPHQLTSGSYFGLWNVVNKMAIAIAPGIALPVLAYLGYMPGQSASSTAWLPFMYALVPCLFRGVAFVLLILSPIDQQPQVVK